MRSGSALGSVVGEGSRQPCLCGKGTLGLRPNKIRQLDLLVEERRLRSNRVVARPRERDCNIRDHVAGAGAHHVNTVGEVQRLVKVMGDVEDVFPRVSQTSRSHSCMSRRV
jgi:hypothetical protein